MGRKKINCENDGNGDNTGRNAKWLRNEVKERHILVSESNGRWNTKADGETNEFATAKRLAFQHLKTPPRKGKISIFFPADFSEG